MTNLNVAQRVELGETEFEALVAEARARYGAARWDALGAAIEAALRQPQPVSIELSPPAIA